MCCLGMTAYTRLRLECRDHRLNTELRRRPGWLLACEESSVPIKRAGLIANPTLCVCFLKYGKRYDGKPPFRCERKCGPWSSIGLLHRDRELGHREILRLICWVVNMPPKPSPALAASFLSPALLQSSSNNRIGVRSTLPVATTGKAAEAGLE